MTLENAPPSNSAPGKAALWTGRIISAIVVLFMGVMALCILIFNPSMATDGMIQYGYPPKAAVPILVAEIVCALIYAIPQTAFLGAILLTGYLGGAVATHVHAAEFDKMVFPIIMGILVWLGLYFREPRFRNLAPWRRAAGGS